jgi:acyl dehydratase
MGMYFEDFQVGDQTVTAARTITEADVVLYAGLSGDYNPIHTDAESARKGPFGQRLAHGPLGFTVMMGLSSRTGQFEGTAIAALGINNYRFLAPIFIGDTVHAAITIAEKRETKNPERGVIVRHFQLINQRGEVTQEGDLPVMVRRRPSSVAAD